MYSETGISEEARRRYAGALVAEGLGESSRPPRLSPKRSFLLLNQFYPPDIAPTGLKLHDVAKELVRRGHDVHVVCSRESYKGTDLMPERMELDGVKITRIKTRNQAASTFAEKIRNYRRFYAALIIAVARHRPRPDLIVSLTTPPFLGLLARVAAKVQHARMASWIMDLYPDVMFAHGLVREHGIASQLLQALAKMELKRCSSVLTLGPDMAERVVRYHPNPVWANLWGDDTLQPLDTDADEVVRLRCERGWELKNTVLLYSGNMGRGHTFDDFLQVAPQSPADTIWAFAGQGPRRSEIEAFKARHTEVPLDLLDYAPADQLNCHLSSGNAHLVSLRPEWQGMLAPSKFQNSFAVGRPVIFVGNRENVLAHWVEESGAGWVVRPGDTGSLLAAVADVRDPLEARRRGRLARNYYDNNFSARKCVPVIANLWEQAACESGRGSHN